LLEIGEPAVKCYFNRKHLAQMRETFFSRSSVTRSTKCQRRWRSTRSSSPISSPSRRSG